MRNEVSNWQIWVVVACGLAILFVVIPYWGTRGSYGTAPESAEQPLAVSQTDSRVFTGKVYRIDPSCADLLAGDMEMVQVELDPGQNAPVRFINAPAPINKFTKGERVSMKMIVYYPHEATNPVYTRVLVRR